MLWGKGNGKITKTARYHFYFKRHTSKCTNMYVHMFVYDIKSTYYNKTAFTFRMTIATQTLC